MMSADSSFSLSERSYNAAELRGSFEAGIGADINKKTVTTPRKEDAGNL